MNASTPRLEICPSCSKKTASQYFKEIDEETRVCIPCALKIESQGGKRRGNKSNLKSEAMRRKIAAWLLSIAALAALVAFTCSYVLNRRKLKPPVNPPTPVLARPASVEKPTPAPVPVPFAVRPAAPAPAVTVTIDIQGDVLFDFGKAIVRPEAASALSPVADAIAKHPGKILIRGYTDSIGSAQANILLSTQRAQGVKDWFVKSRGIDVESISVEGLGASNPVAPNTNPDGSDNPAGRQKNRRVTVTIPK